MALVVDVDFLCGAFAASDGHDGTAPEWPPAPARLFAAFVAACEADDRDALGWLNGLGDPVIDAAAETAVTAPQGRWLVTNQLKAMGGSAQHPGRVNVLRARRRRWLSSTRVRYRWDRDVPTGMAQRLDAIARQVGYLGRPVSPVVVTVQQDHDAPGEVVDGLARFAPEGPDSRSLDPPVHLRNIYPGLLDDLDAAFEAGDRIDPPMRAPFRRQVAALPPPAPAIVPSPWVSFIPFEIDPGVWVPAQRAVQIANALRSALLGRIGDDAHPLIVGHGVDAPHVAFVPLPSVRHPKADGHLLGVAIAIPDADPELAAQVRRALVERDGELSLTLTNVPGHRQLQLVRQGGGSPWGRDFSPYTGVSTVWRTVMPAVLDRAPSRRLSEEDSVRFTVVRAGYPEPVAIWAQRGPIRAGEPSLRMRETLRNSGDRRRPFRYLVVRFPEPVQGPVLLGALRHFGLGLCLPSRDGANDE